jgi:hypothetical protein
MKMNDSSQVFLFKDYYIVVPLLSSELSSATSFIKNHHWFIDNGGKIVLKIGGIVESDQKLVLQNISAIIFLEIEDFSIYNAWNQALDFLDYINICKNSYIIFLGLDDILEEDYLKRVSSITRRRNDIDFLYGDFKSVLGNYYRIFKSPQTPSLFKKNNFSFDVPHPGLVNNWSTIKNYRFSEEYRLGSDLDYYIRISKDRKITHKYIPVIQATIGANGISNNYKAKSLYLNEWKLISSRNSVSLDLNFKRSYLLNLLSKSPNLFIFFRKIYWRIYGKRIEINRNL